MLNNIRQNSMVHEEIIPKKKSKKKGEIK